MKFVAIGCLCAGALAAVGCADGRGIPTSPTASAAPSTSVAVTATQPQSQLVPGVLLATAKPATVVATVNGGGTAEMEPPGLSGRTAFAMEVKLLADGSATGHFDCVDQHGGTFPGNIFGEVTSWSTEGTVIVLNVTGKFLPIPGGHPGPASFTVKIQQFGGAGVGRWTLEVGGFIFCYEILTSGQIVYRLA